MSLLAVIHATPFDRRLLFGPPRSGIDLVTLATASIHAPDAALSRQAEMGFMTSDAGIVGASKLNVFRSIATGFNLAESA